jgi:cell division initiation protein
MLTPQQVQEQKFVKAVFGGYDMATVDEFLNTLSVDYSTLYKENAVLKSKLKVLVESIEEYRSVDESMRRALVAAQKMANDIISEAKRQAAQILSDASSDAQTRKSVICGDIVQEEERLNFAKKETARFISGMRALIEQEAKLLEKVPDLSITETGAKAPDIGTQVSEEIGRSVDAAISEEFPEQPSPAEAQPEENGESEAAPATPATENEAKNAPEPAQLEFDITVFDEIAGTSVSQDTDPRPKFNFDNLQFGKNFSLGKKEKK